MIVRTPTRTKTLSFQGSQMDFKFPSNEDLRDTALKVPHSNSSSAGHSDSNVERKNSHLVSSSPDNDVNSQILSDYTSFSNQASSNEYYSFANISDNTTNKRYVHSPSRDATVKQAYHTTLDPEKANAQKSNESIDKPMIDHQFGRNTFKGNALSILSSSSASQTIPTAANLSYRIESNTSSSSDSTKRSSSSSMPSSHTVVQNKHLGHDYSNSSTLNRQPTITNVGSISRSTISSLSATSSEGNTTTTRSSRSSLKRSNAIRCKGGLLQYFTMIGLGFKNGFKKVRLALRKKLFSFKRTNSIKRSPSVKKSLNQKMMKKPISQPRKTTKSRYVSNLKKSMSSKSLEPVLFSKNVTDISKSLIFPSKTSSPNTNKISTSASNTKLSSLRRTPSSIKRAASVFTSTSVSSKPVKEVPGTRSSSVYSNHNSIASSKAMMNRKESMNARGRLVRSKGMDSLSSLAREPSIVVRNKVIPLSMSHYSIKEVDEEKEEQYTNLRKNQNLANVNRLSVIEHSDSESSKQSSILDEMDDTEFVSLSADEDADTIDTFTNKQAQKQQFQENFASYFTQVLAQRIELRLQVAKFQKTGKLPTENNKYMEAILQVMSQSLADPTLQTSLPLHPNHTSTASQITFPQAPSPFSTVTSLNANNSVLSFNPQDVHRALTLPVGIKV